MPKNVFVSGVQSDLSTHCDELVVPLTLSYTKGVDVQLIHSEPFKQKRQLAGQSRHRGLAPVRFKYLPFVHKLQTA